MSIRLTTARSCERYSPPWNSTREEEKEKEKKAGQQRKGGAQVQRYFLLPQSPYLGGGANNKISANFREARPVETAVRTISLAGRRATGRQTAFIEKLPMQEISPAAGAKTSMR